MRNRGKLSRAWEMWLKDFGRTYFPLNFAFWQWPMLSTNDMAKSLWNAKGKSFILQMQMVSNSTRIICIFPWGKFVTGEYLKRNLDQNWKKYCLVNFDLSSLDHPLNHVVFLFWSRSTSRCTWTGCYGHVVIDCQCGRVKCTVRK